MKLMESMLRLDPARLERLAARWHIAIDPKKRITLAEQVARGLVLVPRWLDLKAAGEGAREALRLLAAAPRGLSIDSLPRDIDALIEDGFIHVDPQRSERLVLPSAFRLQLPVSPSDSPRAARLLLQGISEDARRELCHHHLRRLPPLPWPMLLEPVLERLEDPEWVKAEIASLGDSERALLSAIDALGGEVNGEEVLELEREPVRIAHGGSVQVPRRSAIFSLARRGLAIARPEGWVVPDEVERVVGRERRARAGIERQRLLMSRHIYELTPSRADLAEAPGPLAVALLAALSALRELPSEGRGMSKGAARRAAQQLSIEPERAELLLCLARADGLFCASTTIRSVTERVWSVWRRGGAWDEAAREPDLFRPGHPITARATALIREALLDTLLLLPAPEFARVSDVRAVACADRRALAAQRALSLASRSGQDVLETVVDVVNGCIERSLPSLGLVDRGSVEEGPVVRLSQAARAWLDAGSVERRDERPEPDAEWRSELRLVCGPRSDVAAVIETARYGRVWLEPRGVGIELDAASLAQAADHDPELAGLRAGVSALTESLPRPLEDTIRAATQQRPICTFTPVAGFVRVEDENLREALYADPEGRSLWAGPPLAEGLLLRQGAHPSKVQEILARHGARLFSD